MKIFIETERLIIREAETTDCDGFFELDSNPKVHTYLGNQPIKTKEEASQMIAKLKNRYIENGIGRWVMIEKETNSFVGWTGFSIMKENINGHINHHDLGYRLVEKHWGKGFATESAIASVKYGFEKLNLENIYAIAEVEHAASIHVLEKVGLTKGEIFEVWGKDHFWFQLGRSEWEAQ